MDLFFENEPVEQFDLRALGLEKLPGLRDLVLIEVCDPEVEYVGHNHKIIAHPAMTQLTSLTSATLIQK